jgi:hypothetical protein
MSRWNELLRAALLRANTQPFYVPASRRVLEAKGQKDRQVPGTNLLTPLGQP